LVEVNYQEYVKVDEHVSHYCQTLLQLAVDWEAFWFLI